ncbi:MAG TPA: cytochrome c [Blastocatellia bacterium]|jgi:mono/diheme cytochrome c family protein|nr:cytochrome c [Blastocatellia bacterium]
MRKPLSLILVLSSVAVLDSFVWLESAAQPAKSQGAGGGAAALYTKHCAKCHLADGKGLESLSPPNFTDAKWQSAHTNAAIAKGIREGKETMPPFKDVLSAAQINALVKHIRGFKPKVVKK